MNGLLWYHVVGLRTPVRTAIGQRDTVAWYDCRTREH